MLLSIIIPVYNVEPYLKECLDSVFSQDLTDCEVIAVNDGSTDGSRAILEEYKESHIGTLTVIDKANGGQSSARNLGVKYAKGDFFYFVDSDDYLKPHAIASIKQTLNTADEADTIYFDCIVTDQCKRWEEHSGNDIPVMNFKAFPNYAFEHKLEIVSNPFSYVYSSSYWKKSGLHYEEGIRYEDALFKYELFVRDDGKIKVVHVDEPFYVYRVGREGSTTTKLTLKNFSDKQIVRKKANKLWVELGVKDVSHYHMLFDACTFMLYEAYGCGLLEECHKFWDKEDVQIMRKGVSNGHEYGLWLLAKLSPKWMARYYTDNLPKLSRRLTNIMLTVCRKVFYK